MSFDSKRYATLKNKQTSGQPLSSREFEELQRLDMQASKQPRQAFKSAPQPTSILYDAESSAEANASYANQQAKLKAQLDAVSGLFDAEDVNENIFVQRKRLSKATGIPYEKLRYDVRQGYLESNDNRDVQLKSVMAQLERQIVDYFSAYMQAHGFIKS